MTATASVSISSLQILSPRAEKVEKTEGSDDEDVKRETKSEEGAATDAESNPAEDAAEDADVRDVRYRLETLF